MIDIKDNRSERVKYDYPDYPVYIRRGMLSDFPNYAAESHWHDDIELIAVCSGQMMYNVNGSILALNEGEGILVNSRQLHYGFSDTKTECEFICVLFHPMLLCASEMFQQQYVNPMLNSGISYVHLSNTEGWQSSILEYTLNMYNRKDEKTAPLYIQGLAYLLWAQIISNVYNDVQPNSKIDTKLVILKRMLTYIRENYSRKITLNDIAVAGHVSKRTCGTIFIAYFNRTPIEYLNGYRLRKSIELMKNTDMSILDIGLAVGFSGASYYAEIFRKNFGVCPGEYRKKIVTERKYGDLL